MLEDHCLSACPSLLRSVRWGPTVATRVRPSRPSSARPFSTPRLNLAPPSGFLSLISLSLLFATTVSFGTANRHRVSPETKSGQAIMYIRRLLPRVRRHRDCYSSDQGSLSGGCCLSRKSDEPNFVCPSFPTTAITLDYIIKKLLIITVGIYYSVGSLSAICDDHTYYINAPTTITVVTDFFFSLFSYPLL